MRYILYIIAIFLLIAWAVGFYAFSFGNLLHILLVIALISIILGIIRGRDL
jgi:hypothetical protein